MTLVLLLQVTLVIKTDLPIRPALEEHSRVLEFPRIGTLRHFQLLFYGTLSRGGEGVFGVLGIGVNIFIFEIGGPTVGTCSLVGSKLGQMALCTENADIILADAA